MVATSLSAFYPADPIRQFDLTRDLDQVADLIELCFPIHSDPDGQTYVNDMRKTARELRLMGRLAGLSAHYPAKSSGFVWEENGQIIGNLSLIPLQKDGRRVHLIANVAVRPEHRRCGIARQLTQRALQALHQQRETQVWLQVRDDNPPAIGLYRSLGFSEQAIRTTWRIRPRDCKHALVSPRPNLSVRRGAQCDWSLEQTLLEEAYPQNIRWNLQVNFRRFTPGIVQTVSNFLEGIDLKRWTVITDGRCQGVITWQKSDTYAHNLWLALPRDKEAEILPVSLAKVLSRLLKKHMLSIDYPKGRSAEQLSALGFKEFRSLIWMVHRFK
jgi:ribosomal protein S18 acetylase RimI-like enzyme